MKSKCLIKNVALPYRGEPTRNYHNPALEDDLVTIRTISPVLDFSNENIRDRVKEVCRQRTEKSERKQERVRELIRQGVPTTEIMKDAGYCRETVNKIIRRMRADGENIPERIKRRPKCKK